MEENQGVTSNAICPPAEGEIWIGDNHAQHFGVRAWAGKAGGGKAFAIRLRDQFGTLVRETYSPERDFPLYYWMHAWEKPLAYFLTHARIWAKDRIALHLGLPTSADLAHQLRDRRKTKILATVVGAAFDQKIKHLRRKSHDHINIDQIRVLIDEYIPPSVLASRFRNVPIRQLADAISQKAISYGNVKVLRAFVSGVFKDASHDFPPLQYKLEAIQRRCARNLEARVTPPHPRILEITEGDYSRFFNCLENDPNWRQSLAIRLYFATGAKLQTILRARWSDFIDGMWYPFLPNERKLWFESKERLMEEGSGVLELMERHHSEEQLASPYLFPPPK